MGTEIPEAEAAVTADPPSVVAPMGVRVNPRHQAGSGTGLSRTTSLYCSTRTVLVCLGPCGCT